MRQVLSTTALAALPMTVIAAAGASRGLGWLLLGGHLAFLLVLLVGDVVALGGAVRAARRMRRGLPPAGGCVDYGIGPDMSWVTVPADDPYRAQDRVELAAAGCPWLASRVLGRNLLRRGALALGLLLALGGIAAVCVSPGHRCHHCIGSTATAANSIRSATILYLNGHPGRCPSVAALKAEGLLERGFWEKDVWGNPWELRCTADDIVVRSNGPDRKAGTEDDIVIPAADGMTR